MFRLFAYVCKDMEEAQTAPGPIISLQVVFSGAWAVCRARGGVAGADWHGDDGNWWM
jgi:hypothetical protein